MRTFCAVLGGFCAPFCTISCIMSLHSLRFYAILCTLGSSNICTLSCGSKSFSPLWLPEFFSSRSRSAEREVFLYRTISYPAIAYQMEILGISRLTPRVPIGSVARQMHHSNYNTAKVYGYFPHIMIRLHPTLRAPPPPSPPLDTRRGRELPSAMSEAKRRLWRAER